VFGVKMLRAAFLMALLLSTLGAAVVFGTVQASTDVNGIISSDTTWTKANSPYSLTGPVGVREGVTLTIEPGTTVNLNGYYIIVNGTLHARGSITNKIYFNDGAVSFEPLSDGWNEETNSGSIIENAVGNDEVGTTGSQKITKSSFNEIWIYKGGSTISYNNIGRIIIRDGASSISHNDISEGFTVDDGSPSIDDNTIHKGININGGSPVISNNKIFGIINAAAANGKQISISNNELTSIRIHGMHAEISGNKIIGNGNDAGIDISDSWVYPASASISANQIYGCTKGIVATVDIQVTKNVIFDNEIGLNLWSSAIVQDNTIARITVGIQRDPDISSVTIINNNIQNNSQYNFRLKAQNDINVTNNWWGSINTQAINQTIFDSKNDFNVDTVNFVLFLTAPNSEAPEIPTSPPNSTPTPPPTPSKTPAPTITPNQGPQQTEQKNNHRYGYHSCSNRCRLRIAGLPHQKKIAKNC
jgi:hypothetical protein